MPGTPQLNVARTFIGLYANSPILMPVTTRVSTRAEIQAFTHARPLASWFLVKTDGKHV